MKRTIIYLASLAFVVIFITACDDCWGGRPPLHNSIFVYTNGNTIEATYNTDLGYPSNTLVTDTIPTDENKFISIEAPHQQCGNDIIDDEMLYFDLRRIEGDSNFYVLRDRYVCVNGENISLFELPTEKYTCRQIIDSIRSQCPEKIYTISKSLSVPGDAVNGSVHVDCIELSFNE